MLKKSLRKSLLFVGLVAATGCAHEPIIDHRGVDHSKYQQDLAECRGYAAQVNTPGETAKGGAIGGAIGAAVGAIIGDSTDAEQGVGIGAIWGGTEGFSEAERRKQKIMYRCLKGRGYKVLG